MKMSVCVCEDIIFHRFRLTKFISLKFFSSCVLILGEKKNLLSQTITTSKRTKISVLCSFSV